MWKLLVKEQMQACWIRAFVVSCWSTVSARGWSAWGYHLWRVRSSNRYWEILREEYDIPYQNYGEVEDQPARSVMQLYLSDSVLSLL